MKPIYRHSGAYGITMAWVLAGSLFAQSTNKNFIQTEVAQQPVKTENTLSALSDKNQRYRSVQYFDGLGRPVQSLEVKASPSGKDKVNFQEHDAFGRVSRHYLPYESGTSNNGVFRNNPLAEHDLYYDFMGLLPASDRDFAFGDQIFEPSPLDRVIETGSPGADWQISQGHTRKTAFRTNDLSLNMDIVPRWDYQPANESFSYTGSYPANMLTVVESEDENGSKEIEYTDKAGRMVLKRVQVDGNSTYGNASAWASTAFLYDHFGRLRHVIQPEGVKKTLNNGGNLNAGGVLDKLTFSYQYDERGRVSAKKVPGADWVYMVYDPLDRLVLTQDGTLRELNINWWTFTKYDALGRAIMTGIYENTAQLSQGQIQENILTNCENGSSKMYENRSGSNFPQQQGYTNQAFPSQASVVQLHSVSWYDDYDFNGDGLNDRTYVFEPEIPNNQSFPRQKGMLTGIRVWVLNPDPDMADSLLTVTFYDDRGRSIQTASENHIGGFDQTTNKYDFAGNILRSVERHSDANQNFGVIRDFIYDHRARLLETIQTNEVDGVKSDPVLLVQRKYDALGRMSEKNFHSVDQGAHFVQSVDYQYNIRNWLTDINQINTSCGEGNSAEVAVNIQLESVNIELMHFFQSGIPMVEIGISDNKSVTFQNPEGETYTREANLRTSKRIVVNSSTDPGAVNTSITSYFQNLSVSEGNYSEVRNQIISDIGGALAEGNIAQGDIDGLADAAATLLEEEFANIYGDDDAEDVFGMKIHYNDGMISLNSNANPLYNGNISGLEWQSPTDCNIKGYGFEYDKMNRLNEAHFAAQNSSGTWNQQIDRYSVNEIQYDLNGNIKKLKRKGKIGNSSFGLIDNLTYTYNGNQLTKVKDNITSAFASLGIDHFVDGNPSGTDYSYDDGGNLTTDHNKGINMDYNYLSKTVEVQFGSGDRISYIYDAAGTKLRKKVIGNTVETQDYVNGYTYIDQQLMYAIHDEGRMNFVNQTEFTFQYNITDHLGNVRVTFQPDEANVWQIVQEDHYYPFGLRMGGLSYQSGLENDYRFNGKELESDLNLGWYDYGARMYNPEIGRWNGVDILGEGYVDVSSYSYAHNSPVYKTDMNGNWDITVHVYNNREQYGYGIAVVTDRHGNEIFRFEVRVEGIGGRDRMVTNSDTPLGVYDIPDDKPWKSGGSRLSFGPNQRLRLNPKSGEILKSGRSLIRMHGGRQEKYDNNLGQWVPVATPKLMKTKGCLRTYDADILTLYNIVQALLEKDSDEFAGEVHVIDDLVEADGEYYVPGEEPQNESENGSQTESESTGTTYSKPGKKASAEEQAAWNWLTYWVAHMANQARRDIAPSDNNATESQN